MWLIHNESSWAFGNAHVFRPQKKAALFCESELDLKQELLDSSHHTQ